MTVQELIDKLQSYIDHYEEEKVGSFKVYFWWNKDQLANLSVDATEVNFNHETMTLYTDG